MLNKVRECLANKDSERWSNKFAEILSEGKIEANKVKFVLKGLAFDTFINLKIEHGKYVKYVRNDIGHRIRETASL